MLDHTFIITAILAMLPISELRGAIPYAVANGWAILPAALLAFLMNAMVSPLAFLFLESLHRLFYRWSVYASLFDRLVERARAKVHAKVERYGHWGLLFFVAIPLPITGAWTGTLGAWILGMSKRKTMAVIAVGVAIACVVVSLVVYLGLGAFSIFLKEV